jgi:hypothetical protein
LDNKEIVKNLEAIYSDYYDGLYTESQLKHLLLKLYKNTNVSSTRWSEMTLDAQWKYATEEDYEVKRKQIVAEYEKEAD